jgi:hypothetical protein
MSVQDTTVLTVVEIATKARIARNRVTRGSNGVCTGCNIKGGSYEGTLEAMADKATRIPALKAARILLRRGEVLV